MTVDSTVCQLPQAFPPTAPAAATPQPLPQALTPQGAQLGAHTAAERQRAFRAPQQRPASAVVAIIERATNEHKIRIALKLLN